MTKERLLSSLLVIFLGTHLTTTNFKPFARCKTGNVSAKKCVISPEVPKRGNFFMTKD
jgi:hypothetical protein